MMKTKKISEYITVTYVEGGKYDRQTQKAERKERQLSEWEKERNYLKKWLRTPEAKKDVNYSDIFKDVYGFRPSW